MLESEFCDEYSVTNSKVVVRHKNQEKHVFGWWQHNTPASTSPDWSRGEWRPVN